MGSPTPTYLDGPDLDQDVPGGAWDPSQDLANFLGIRLLSRSSKSVEIGSVLKGFSILAPNAPNLCPKMGGGSGIQYTGFDGISMVPTEIQYTGLEELGGVGVVRNRSPVAPPTRTNTNTPDLRPHCIDPPCELGMVPLRQASKLLASLA